MYEVGKHKVIRFHFDMDHFDNGEKKENPRW